MSAVVPGITTGHGLLAVIYDALVADACLGPLLDIEKHVTHGTADWCDEPTNTHLLPAIRRSQMGQPGHFEKAVVTFGIMGKNPFQGGNNRPHLEDWIIKADVFVRSPVVEAPTAGSPAIPIGDGDVRALEIYQHVVRILGWDQTPPPFQTCGPDFLVMIRRHIADSLPLGWNEDHRWWRIGTRFRWTVLSRGLVAPPPCVPCGPNIGSVSV